MSEGAGRAPDSAPLALMVRTPDEPGVLHALTSVILEHRANITYVDIAERREGDSTVYFELEDLAGGTADVLIGDLEALPMVRVVEQAPSPRPTATTSAASGSR